MKIATVRYQGQLRVGVVDGGSVTLLAPTITTLDLLCAGADERDALAARHGTDRVALDDVALRSPVKPGCMRDFVSFERHVEGAARAVEGKDGVPAQWYEGPTMLFMNPHSAIGSGEAVEIPPGALAMDYELEVGAVIGRDGRNLTPEQAAEHIVGYTICNDWSARDLQSREMKMGLGPAKGKDFATTLGPWIVTTDELEAHRVGDRLDLAMSVSLNGIEMGADRLANMAWSFEELVAYATRGAWVRAGDVLASGTCSGGALAEAWGRTGTQLPPPLQAGDVVTMTVEGIGAITNSLVAGPSEASPIPPARRLG